MSKFTNPLDNIRVASPCTANWDEMYGDNRKRFCGECKLNVYNLSEMTRREAENLLINSEGRLCVRFYRRADGTVLTKNCPVGWRAIKANTTRVATAAFAMVFGMVSGIASVWAAGSIISIMPMGDVIEPREETITVIAGSMELNVSKTTKAQNITVGRVTTIDKNGKEIPWVPNK